MVYTNDIYFHYVVLYLSLPFTGAIDTQVCPWLSLPALGIMAAGSARRNRKMTPATVAGH